MKNKLSKIITIILVAIFGLSLVSCTQTTHAEGTDICSMEGNIAQEVYEAAGCKKNADQLPKVITGILYAIIAVSGLVAVIFIIIGGVNYMTSSGDAGKLEKAKKTILYASIGIVICALAFAIVNWTINAIESGSNNNSSQQEDNDKDKNKDNQQNDQQQNEKTKI